MVLELRSPSKYNEMRGRTLLPDARLGKGNGLDARPSKRIKHDPAESGSRDHSDSEDVSPPYPYGNVKSVISDSDAESGADTADDVISSQPTDLERALPPIKTDREAIEDYEAMRAAEGAMSPGLHQRIGNREWVTGKSSIYVDAFNLALETVLEDESHLFDEAEMTVFGEWRKLSYEAQYLYVRLFLRKNHAWHRINKLGYYSDVSDLNAAKDDLFSRRQLPEISAETEIKPGDIKPLSDAKLQGDFTFAEASADHITTLEQASSLLMLEELKPLAKEAKLQGKNKTELLKAFQRTSRRQTSLSFTHFCRTETEDSITSETSEYAQSSREPSPTKQDIHESSNRDAYFLRKILSQTGPCIRLASAPLKLFERVHLVFYRSTEWTEKSLTTIILARISRRNFPEYIVSRSANIFASRSLLLEFEASLRTQFYVDNILEMNGTPTQEKLQEVLDIFEEVLPRWRTLLIEEQQKEDSIYMSGEGAYLRRLSPAWVYTRIVHKGAYVMGLGKFKHHKREHEILSELLEQRLFHANRRGSWYQRKALLEEHYMHSHSPTEGRTVEEQRKHWKRVALRTCEEGLQDHLVHLIYHYDLQKRLMKLEKALKVAKRHQHEFAHVTLSKPTERVFSSVRIEKRRELKPLARRPSDPSQLNRRGGKTLWLDPYPEEAHLKPPADSKQPQTYLSVEEMCLSHYRHLGWKGYHTEGGLLRTVFGLLFYDILFSTYVPNVFQTPYQTAPLDLHAGDASFVAARISAVNARLAEIDNGNAEDILREVWEREAERKTCVIGVDWGFELSELCELVRAFGGVALSRVLLVLAQEYSQRGGGVPDLLLWRTEAEEDPADKPYGEVMFAEVKSENDRLSDTQRLWIHVLSGAGVRVELCNALASEVKVIVEP